MKNSSVLKLIDTNGIPVELQVTFRRDDYFRRVYDHLLGRKAEISIGLLGDIRAVVAMLKIEELCLETNPYYAAARSHLNLTFKVHGLEALSMDFSTP